MNFREFLDKVTYNGIMGKEEKESQSLTSSEGSDTTAVSGTFDTSITGYSTGNYLLYDNSNSITNLGSNEIHFSEDYKQAMKKAVFEGMLDIADDDVSIHDVLKSINNVTNPCKEIKIPKRKKESFYKRLTQEMDLWCGGTLERLREEI